ncbi:MAG: pirin family protein [Deltaproteobacteria bacterium]|nr:pirin family protein [Deltaproteobacteria bacterium]
MLKLRPANQRGHADHGWLDTHHTFSFADYYDPNHVGFRALRVMNEDRVAPGRGFGPHPHRDMEIVSYVVAGALSHKDSMGNGSVITPGDVQRMTAGTGVVHSEQNASRAEPVHFLQIWLIPNERGLTPSYEQRRFEDADKRGKLRLVASPDGAEGSVKIHAEARIYAAILDEGVTTELPLASGRHAYVQLVRGRLSLAGYSLAAGDGAALSDESVVKLTGIERAEVLVFDLA